MDGHPISSERQAPDKAFIIMVMGLPGSGKSYFAERLAKDLDATYLSSDRIRKDRSPENNYDVEAKRMVYQLLATRAEEAIKSSRKVVVDATFHLKEFRDIFTSLVEKLGCANYWVLVDADEALIKERVGRPRKESEADFKVYQLLKGEYEAPHQPHLKLTSTDENLEEMLEKAKAYFFSIAS
jgi:predicted kinase